jgi:tripartite-type tricarboxylate transporter receptor subunit TctC
VDDGEAVAIDLKLPGVMREEDATLRSVAMAWAAGVTMAFCAAGAGYAQTFPMKPVRMVVHIGPGSSMDIVGRVIAQKLNEAWGQPVIVDNRAGAGGTLGIDVVAKAVPDGYTLLFGTSSIAIAASYYRKLPFDALRDLEPVTQISSRHNALVVGASSPVNSVKDLIAIAKAKPGQVSFGSGGGSGSSDHLAGELFGLSAGVKLMHVPYKSGPGALNDLMSGQLSFYLGGIPSSLPMIRAGKIKALGTSGLKRSPQLPNVPTIAESGLPGFEVNVWYGLFAPRGTPARVVEKIAGDVGHILSNPETRERLSALGVEAEGGDTARFKTYYRNDLEKWKRVVKAAGISDSP